jgi:hypothetical protein
MPLSSRHREFLRTPLRLSAHSPQAKALDKWLTDTEREDAGDISHSEHMVRKGFGGFLGGQGQLFDPATTRPKRVDEMSPEEWSEQEGTVFHGTYRGDEFRQGPTFHVGTRQSAFARLGEVTRSIRTQSVVGEQYYNPGLNPDTMNHDPNEDREHSATLHAMRLDPSKTSPVEYTDEQANSADLIHQARTGNADYHDISGSVRDSAHPLSRRYAERMSYDEASPMMLRSDGTDSRKMIHGARQLRQGNALPYRNFVEDSGSLSAVVPRNHPVSTWDSDVLADPSSHPNIRWVAEQRSKQGLAGTIAFDANEIDRSVDTSVALDGSLYRAERDHGIVNRHQFRT